MTMSETNPTSDELRALAYGLEDNGNPQAAAMIYNAVSDFETALSCADARLEVMNRQAAELARKDAAIEKFAEAERVVALHLADFCNKDLPYNEMVADAARKAGRAIEKAREALEPFAEAAKEYKDFRPQDEDETDQALYDIFQSLTLADFMKAIAAMAAGG
jgi:hypothetical protein